MRHSLTRLRAVSAALALTACAKQQPLPVANFVGITQDALTVATGQQIVLDASNSVDPADPSGANLSFEWSFVSLPAGSRAKIESPHNARTRFTADVPTSVTDKYVLSLVVKNKSFLSAPHLLTITALDCGASVPQINSIIAAPTSINIATPVLLTAAVDDKDNDAACQPSLGNVKQTEKYRWTLTALPPGSKAHLRDPTAVLAAFNPDVAGTYTVTLILTDSTGRSSNPVHIDVQVAACGGAAPGINAITSSPASPNLAQPTQLSADVTDADNSPICGLTQGFTYAWSVVGLPSGSSARLNDPLAVNPNFTPDVPGDYRFTLVVTDSTGRRSAPQPFVVTVKDCGGAPPTPIVQFIPASAGIGQPVSLTVKPQDSDAACGISETFSYVWSLVSVPGGSNARIVAAMGVIADPNVPAVASLVPDVGGDYAINVTIIDSRGSSASALTHLTVAACGNNPPSVDRLTGLPLTPLVGQNVHVTAQVSDADSSCAGFNPVQTFRWNLSMRPAGSAAALEDPTARAADFAPDVIGHYQLSLVVTDATGLGSAPALFDLQTSTCGNSAPQIVSVGASSPSPDPGTPFTLFAQTSDPDNGGGCNLGQAVSLRWEIASRPAGSSATLSNPAAATPSFTADVPGSYQFSAVATDSTSLRSAPSFLTVNTTSCGTAIPTVTAVPASITVQPFQTVQLAATPFDADTSCGVNETFSYAWKIVSSPTGSGAMLSDPGGAAPSFVPDLSGSYLLSVAVTDSRGHVSPGAFVTVSVTSCAALPPTTGAIKTATPPSLGLPVTLSAPSAKATACGASAALQYAWSLSAPAGSHAMLDDPTAATSHFTPDVAGAYQAGLVVRDSHGLDSTKAVLNLSVAPCGTSNLSWNAAPELTPALTEPNGTTLTASLTGGVWTGAFVGTSVAMNAGFIDPPGCGTAAVQPFTYQWALVSRPAGSAAHLDSGSAAKPSFAPDLPGDYQVAARVGDAMGALLPTRFATLQVPGCGTTLPVVAITPPGSTTLNTFQPLHLTVAGGTATDADNVLTNCPARFAPGATFTYAWSVSPSGATLASATGDAVNHSNDFTGGVPGKYTVQLVATAANGLQSLPATLALTVGNCGSHPPVIAQVTTTTTAGGLPVSLPQVLQSVTMTAFATDADSSCPGYDPTQTFQWALRSAPSGSSVCTPSSPCATAGASVPFTPDVAGTYQFTVIATDATLLNSTPYTVSVHTATCAPSVASITPSNGAPAINQPFTLTAATPVDTCVGLQVPAFAYAWRIVSAPRGSTAMLSSSTGVSTAFTADVAGAYQFEVVATDQAGFSSAPTTLQLSAGTCALNPPQLDPIVAKLGGSVVTSGSFNAGDQLVLSSVLHDLNSACGALTQPYHWQWTLLSRPAGSAATLAQTDATPIFVPDLPGSYQVSAQATDALGNVSAPAFGTLITSPCGTAAPVATSFAATQTVAGLNVAGYVTPQTLTITHTTLPGTAAPNVNRGVQFYGGTPVSVSANVKDDDASCGFPETIAYSWSFAAMPAGSIATLNEPTSPTPSFVPDLPGEYDLRVTLTDSTGRSNTQTFAVVPSTSTALLGVSSCGINAPIASIAVTSPLAVAAPVTGISLPVGSAVALNALPSSDPDNALLNLTPTSTPPGVAGSVSGCGLNQTLTYRWTVFATPAAAQPLVLSSTTLPNPAFSASASGDYGLELTVSDGARSGKARITARAHGVGGGTIVANPTAPIVGPGNGTTLTVTVLDTDGQPLAAAPVSLTVTAGFTGTNTLTPSSGTTNASGQFTSLFTATKAGGSATKNGESKTVQATSGSTPAGSITLDFLPDAVNDIFWFVQPCNTPAGNTIRCPVVFPEVDGEDQFGNVVTAYTSTVTLTVQQQPNNSTVGGTLTQNAGTPFNDLTIDKTGTYQLLATVTDTLPGSNSVLSNTFQGLLPPPNPPVITSSTATTPREIKISWDGSLNNSGNPDKTILQYHVFRALGAVPVTSLTFVEIAVPTIAALVCGGSTSNPSYTSCSYTDTDAALLDGTQYTYYVAADNSGSNDCSAAGSCSNPSNITQQFTMPGAATNLNITFPAPAQNTIQVNWSPPSNGIASSYDVRRANSAGGTYNTVSGGGALTTTTLANGPATTDNSLAVNTDYFYKIRSRITGAVAPATNPNTVQTAVGVQGTTLPPALVNFGTNSVAYNSITLGWDPVGGSAAVTYEVDRGTTGAYVDFFTGLTSSTFVNNAATNLPVYPGVTYHYQAFATNAGGNGPVTADLPVTTPAAPWTTSSTGLEGGWINTLVADASFVFAGSGKPTDATTAGGAYKFVGATTKWGAVNNGIPNGRGITSMAARRTLSGSISRLYAGTDGSGVLVSLDGGTTWNQFGTGLLTGNVTAVFLDSSRTVWAGTSAGAIFKLPDLTTAWVSTGTTATQSIQAFAEDTHTPKTMYAQATGGAAAGGGLLSIDEGAGTNWAQANTGLSSPDCSTTRSNAAALVIDTVPANSVIYWGSKTCGLLSRDTSQTTWGVVAGYTTAEITRLVVDHSSATPTVWVAAAGAGVSFNSGAATFTAMTGGPTGWEPTALVYDSTNLYAGSADGSGVYRSTTPTTGGAFGAVRNGLSNVSVKFLTDDPSDTSHTRLLAAGDQFGVATSADQGGSWNVQTLPTECTNVSVSGFVYNSNHSATGNIAFLVCDKVSAVFVGMSNGTSWSKQPCAGLPATPTFSPGMAIQSGSPDTLWLATTTSNTTTLYSTVAFAAAATGIAQTCTPFSPALPAAVTTATAIGVDGNGALYVGSPNNSSYTFKSGTSAAWTLPLAATSGPKSVIKFFFDTGNGNVYAAGKDDGTGVGGVWRGPISGVTPTTSVVWTSRSVIGMLTSMTATGYNGFVNGSGVVPIQFTGTSMTPGSQYAKVFNINGGTTWLAAADGIIGGNVAAFALPDATGVALGSTNVLAATTGAGVFKTTSGGQ